MRYRYFPMPDFPQPHTQMKPLDLNTLDTIMFVLNTS